jgi:hypothetical protein
MSMVPSGGHPLEEKLHRDLCHISPASALRGAGLEVI